ncbi:aminopeptidase [Kaarinaea lacus]
MKYINELLRSRKWLIIAMLLVMSTGCSKLGYYQQSVSGHLDLMWSRVDIEDMLEDPDTAEELKQKLRLVLRIRDFASEEMALPRNDSYRSYVHLDRPYVVWNVIAAPEFSLELRQWCFLFVGCVRYRGYYALEDAQQYGDQLRQQGEDVSVRGATAYSTLGWFDDPMLSTIIKRNEPRLAGLIFHELAHQVLYIDDDTAFNESFARAVELEGVRRWMDRHGTPQLAQKYLTEKHYDKDFLELVNITTEQLKTLYQEEIDAGEMRQRKAQIFDNMRNQYQQLKIRWDGYDGYDKWFAKDLNNAKLGAVSIYRDYVPAFQALLRENNNELNAFYAAAERIGELPKEQRQKEMQRLGGDDQSE